MYTDDDYYPANTKTFDIVNEIYNEKIKKENIIELVKSSQDTGIIYYDFEKEIEPILYDYYDYKEQKNIHRCIKLIIEKLTERHLNDIQTSNMPLYGEEIKIPEIRFKNVPDSYKKEILNVGADSIDKFVKINGSIIAMTDLELKVDTAIFECRSCFRIHEIKQENNFISEPSVCVECSGRQFKLLVDESKYVDARTIIVEEKDSAKTVPTKIKVELFGKLTKEVDLNEEIEIVGFHKTEKNVKEEFFKNVIKANNIVPADTSKIELNPKDEKEIKEIANDKQIMQRLIDSLAPNISYPDIIKKALLCYLVKGVTLPNGSRKEIHILIVGDPGTGKSKLAREIIKLADIYTIAEGPASTGVGLTASVVKEPLLNKNIVELGAFPKAHKGHCYIDEFDKLPREELNNLHNTLESGETFINKSGVHRNVKTEVSLLATSNPKYDCFDRYQDVKDQFNLPETIFSRFDLKFTREDIPDKEKDKEIAEQILGISHEKNKENIIDHDTLKKYLKYARQLEPKFTEDAEHYARDYYVKTRTDHYDENNPIRQTEARNLEVILRLAGALAKLRLNDTITLENIEEAVEILEYSFKQVGIDFQTGKLDASKYRGCSTNENSINRNKILEIIQEECDKTLSDQVQQNVVLNRAKNELNIGQATIIGRINELLNHKDIIKKNKGRYVYYKLCKK